MSHKVCANHLEKRRPRPGKRDQCIISIQTEPQFYLDARDALRKAGMKFPSSTKIRVIEGAEHLKGLV